MHPIASITRRQRTFGYTEEEVRILLTPMGQTGAEPLGAMGSDTPVAVLSERPRLLFDYFTQQFAQVTNPPLDSIREEVVTSLSLGLGPERNLLVVGPGPHARRDARLPGHRQRRAREDPAHRHGAARPHLGHDPRPLPRRGRPQGHAEAPRADVRRGRPGDRGRRRVHRAERPRLEQGPRADPVAAHARGRAPPPHPQRDPHEVRPRRRGGRRARSAPRRDAHRVRRIRRQPVPRDGDGRVPRPRRLHHRHRAREGRQEPDLRARQGRAEDHVEDGHLDGLVVRRRAGVRGRRPLAGLRRPLLHRHRDEARRSRPRRHRDRERRAARLRLPAGCRGPRARAAVDGRRVPVAPRRLAAPLQPRHGVPAAALDAHAPVRHLPRVHEARRRPGERAEDPARPVPAQDRTAATACRSTRSSRSRRSSSASRRAR